MIDASNKLMPSRKTQAKWFAYVLVIPYIYIMIMVDEKQEKVLEEQRKYEALRVVRALKYPFRASDPEYDQKLIVAHAVERERMKQIGKKI